MASLAAGRASIRCVRSSCSTVHSIPKLRGASLRTAPALAALARYYASKSFPSHTIISMPALSPTMTAGNIGTWQKKAGDSLAPGDVLVEIETDKAQMDFEFQEEGVLAKVLKDSGEKDVAVGSPIAVLVEDEGDVAAFESFTVDDAGGDKKPPSKDSKQEAADASEPPSKETDTAPPPKDEGSGIQAQESDSTGGKLETALSRAPKISPAAQKLALEKGVPIGQLKGTGPGGQITKSDVEKFEGGSAAAPAAGPVESYVDTEATSMRKTIAQRLTQSMNQNPHFYVSSTVSVSKLLKLRVALNATANGQYKLSVNDLLIKALASACQKVPQVNSSWRDEGGKVFIRQNNIVDVSVAVATPVGLMTPIVKNAGGLGLTSISAQVKDFAKRAKDGKLKPEEYQGGTVTISNMGQNDAVERFTAVINPPQAAILAVGTVKKVAIPIEAEDGKVETDWDEQIVLTASFDHKVVDGAVGATFMQELKKIVENPLDMLL